VLIRLCELESITKAGEGLSAVSLLLVTHDGLRMPRFRFHGGTAFVAHLLEFLAAKGVLWPESADRFEVQIPFTEPAESVPFGDYLRPCDAVSMVTHSAIVRSLASREIADGGGTLTLSEAKARLSEAGVCADFEDIRRSGGAWIVTRATFCGRIFCR